MNGRYFKNALLHRAIEDAYKGYSMSGRYPFTVLMIQMDGQDVDVNVHPTKMEVRFANQDEVYRMTRQSLVSALKGTELIPDLALTNAPIKQVSRKPNTAPEPF